MLRGTLGDIAAQVLAAVGIKSTAVIIVGRVLAAEGFRDSHLYSSARSRAPIPPHPDPGPGPGGAGRYP